MDRYKDIYSTSDGSKPETVASELENDNEPKVNSSEKRTLRLQEKLEKLRNKFEEKPPKSVFGKKLAVARLDRLSNMVDKRININNVKNISKSTEYSLYDQYLESSQDLLASLSDLTFSKENILRQIQRLEQLDSTGKNSMFAQRQEQIQKNTPKGYKPKESHKQLNNNNSKVALEIKKMQQELKLIEDEITAKNEMLDIKNERYLEDVEKTKESLKNELAVVKPSIFKRFKDFIKRKAENYRNKRAEKREKAQESLDSSMKTAEGTSKREVMISSLAGDYTLEEQAKYSAELQEKLSKKKEESTPVREEDEQTK